MSIRFNFNFEQGGAGAWLDECRRTVAYLKAKGTVPSEEAAGLLLAELEREALALLSATLDDAGELPEWLALEERGGVFVADSLSDDEWEAAWTAIRKAGAERQAALWNIGPEELSPIDAALVKRLKGLGDTKSAKATEKGARDASEPARKWRAWHPLEDTVLDLRAFGADQWPPKPYTLAFSADGGLLWLLDLPGLPEGVREDWNTMVRALPAADEPDPVNRNVLGLLEERETQTRAEWAAVRRERRQTALAWIQGNPTIQAQWKAPVRLVRLALALWEHGGVKAEWERRERARKSAGAVPAMHPVTRSIVAGASMGALVATKTGAVDLEGEGGLLVRGWIQPAAAVSLPGGRLALERESDLPGLVAAVLARKIWEAAQRGEQEPRIVTIPAAVNPLRQLFGGTPEEEALDAAIDFLRSVSVAGGMDAKGRGRGDWPLIEKVHTELQKPPRGGRPSKVRVVHCGWPLAPWALKGRYLELGVDLPSELRFVSGVLDPRQVPLTGDKRTWERQRLAMALGLPAWLAERHREEYAERGGVRLEAQDVRRDWEAYSKDRWGLYVRSHASLPEALLEAAVVGTMGRGGVAKPVLPGMPGGPVLVETERGSGLYRMEDEGQHVLLLEAGGKTVAQRKRRLRGLERERRRREKAQRPPSRRKKKGG